MPGGRERRKHIRLTSRGSSASGFAAARPAKLPEPAMIADISEGGVRLGFAWSEGVRFPLEPGDTLNFTLKIEGCDQVFEAGGTIRRAEFDAEADCVWVGVEFRPLPEEVSAALKTALMSLAVAKLRGTAGGESEVRARAALSRRAPFEAAEEAKSVAPAPGKPSAESARKRRKLFIGEILVKQGAIGEEALAAALGSQSSRQVPIGRRLVDQGLIDDVTVARALAEQARLPFLDLVTDEPDMQAVSALPRPVFMKHRCLPLRDEGSSLLVAMAGSPSLPVVEELEASAGKRIRVGIAPERKLGYWLKRVYDLDPGRSPGGLRFTTRLRAGYRLVGTDDHRPRHGNYVETFTRELTSQGLVLAGPLPEGWSPARVTGGEVRMEVQVECAAVLEQIRLLCRPTSIENGERQGEFHISCAIERFPEGGPGAWERLCMVASTIRFRPKGR